MKSSLTFKPALVKLILLSAICMFICLTRSSVWASGKAAINKKLNQLEEFHKRDGLPNLFYKIKTSRQVRIAYLGGSITAAEPGWRDLTFSWFRLNFPQTSFYQTNAAIGGTGSALGVFRLEQDVLRHNPDLLFVEFAVNDGGQPREKILRSMEGIVRKCWNHHPELDIIFVYTAVEQHCKNLVEGKVHPSVLAMEELADYYGIPSVHMGIEVARLYAAGKLVFSGEPADNKNTIVFTKDHTHPLAESGHPIYANIVGKYLGKMKNKSGKLNHPMPKPYVADNWENARMLDLAGMEKTGNWEKLPAADEMAQGFSKFLPALYKASPGSSLRFNFSGKVLALYDLMGPGTGKLKVVIDGRETEISRFDSYCVYYRLGMAVVADTLEAGLHTAEITVLDGGIDKENIIFRDRVFEMHKSPELYKKTDWYAGNILIVDKVSPPEKLVQDKLKLLPADWDSQKNGSIWFTVTQGDYDASRKEYIVFGKLE